MKAYNLPAEQINPADGFQPPLIRTLSAQMFPCVSFSFYAVYPFQNLVQRDISRSFYASHNKRYVANC